MTNNVNIGLMFSFRNTDPQRPFTDVYTRELDLIRDAERLGYDTVWLTEHHFADDGYSPSIVPLAAAIAAITEHVRIGFNLLLLPMHHPVRLAEDLATIDVISNGRLDLGVGQGYAVHEFAGFGIPKSARLGRFLEGLDILEGLWANDKFSYDGKHYQIDGAKLMPKPVQQPGPPLWIGATAETAVRRAGKRGANLLGLANEDLQAAYEESRQEAGFSLESAKILQLHWVHVAETDDEAWDQAGDAFRHLLEVYGQWGAEVADLPTPATPDVAELRRGWSGGLFQPYIGSPETVLKLLQESMAKTLTTHLALGVLPGMKPELTLESMKAFIKEVAPKL